MTRVTKNGGWMIICNGDDSCKREAPDKELVSRGFEWIYMNHHGFSEWERVIVAHENGIVCGYCTVAKTDCIPNVTYTPYIGYLFVDEAFRGQRLGQQLIQFAMEYLRVEGFAKVYLISDHEKLYEKYGFAVVDRALAPWGTMEKIYSQILRSLAGSLLVFSLYHKK